MDKMKIALVGGDGRDQGRFPPGVQIERVPAPKYTGNGRWESFLAALPHGRADRIVLLTRWIGHSASGALKQAAARAGVPLVEVTGGTSMAVRAVEGLVAAVGPSPRALTGCRSPALRVSALAAAAAVGRPPVRPRGRSPADRRCGTRGRKRPAGR